MAVLRTTQFGRLALAVLMFAALLAMALSGCASSGAPASQRSGEAPALEVNDYLLGPGDNLRISVFGLPDLTGEFLIGEGGFVDFPLIGEVAAEGRTVPQLRVELAQRLRQGYVREPNVNVEVLNYRPFYILGEVGEPGTYPFSAGLTVMRAVATAGGFTYRANSRRVFIQHAGQDSETEYQLTSTTPVQPGDTVRIPERRF